MYNAVISNYQDYIIQAGGSLHSPPAAPSSAIFHHSIVHITSAYMLEGQTLQAQHEEVEVW